MPHNRPSPRSFSTYHSKKRILIDALSTTLRNPRFAVVFIRRLVKSYPVQVSMEVPACIILLSLVFINISGTESGVGVSSLYATSASATAFWWGCLDSLTHTRFFASHLFFFYVFFGTRRHRSVRRISLLQKIITEAI